MPADTPLGRRTRPFRLAGFFSGLLILVVAACAPARMPLGPAAGSGTMPASLDGDRFVTDDGMTLPLRVWLPDPAEWPEPKAVILALHGFNDYSNAFDRAGRWWAVRGIATYAYDQRGFGGSPHRGLWAGTETLAADVTTASRLLAERHPNRPLYLLGESMGGAVAIAALTRPNPPRVQGTILSAPAVWARETMPFYQRAALWLAARTIPWARFTGRGLGIQASDNIEMLRALGRDPVFIKETRVDAMDGLTDLMSEALEAAPRFTAPALLLYGEKDQVVPKDPTFRFWRGLPPDAMQRRALYVEGWHMLLRDLQAEVVMADIADWIGTNTAPLPSGADRHAESALRDDETERTVAEDGGEPAGAEAGS